MLPVFARIEAVAHSGLAFRRALRAQMELGGICALSFSRIGKPARTKAKSRNSAHRTTL
jgi:hypothetical protein